MKKVLFFAVPLILVGLVVALLVLRARPKHVIVPKPNPHAQGIDREMRALKAMLNAPEGKTPCESAWNTFSAGDQAGREPGATRYVIKLAPHDEFMSRCNALPPMAQACLAPAYARSHRDECIKAKPSPDLLTPMFELKPQQGVSQGEIDGEKQFRTRPK
jgi:hypothetical protein